MEELIRRLKSNPDFVEFTDFILDKLKQLDSVVDLGEMSNEKAGEEAKIRVKTIDRLYEILRPFIEFNEKKKRTESEINKAGGKYGL